MAVVLLMSTSWINTSMLSWVRSWLVQYASRVPCPCTSMRLWVRSWLVQYASRVPCPFTSMQLWVRSWLVQYVSRVPCPCTSMLLWVRSWLVQYASRVPCPYGLTVATIFPTIKLGKSRYNLYRHIDSISVILF